MTGLAMKLRERVHGSVVAPGDEGWDRVRRGWNLHVDQRPAAVVEVADVADVAAAVRVAADHGVPVAAQPRGHGATAALDGTVLLRTGALDALELDHTQRTVRIGAGVRWQRLNEALTGTGLTGLPGSSSDPSVVGYTVGGGLSWFGRRHGLAAHQVRAADVVSPSGALARVTRDSDPDLFWALRGGGGEFGIVTALELDLLLAPHVYGGRLLWPAAHARTVLAAFVEATRSAPETLTYWAWLLQLPDGQRLVAVAATYLGDAADGERLLDPLLRATPPPLENTLGTVPLAALGDIAGEPTEPTPIVDGALLLDAFDVPAVDALLDAAPPGQPSPLAAVAIRHLGGALSRPEPHHGAAGHLPEPYVMVTGGPVPHPDTAVEVEEGVARVLGALARFGSGRTPPNFGDDAVTAYPPDVLTRLRRVKRERDPYGVVRGNRPLLPAILLET
jgi:FAD/FMN-containing dehydrogenase